MRKLSVKLLGVVIISAALSLGDFARIGSGAPSDPSSHGWGQCVWGGQNEDWSSGQPAIGPRACPMGRSLLALMKRSYS